MKQEFKVSGLYYESKTPREGDDFEWLSFGGSKSVMYGVLNDSSSGMYFSFPSRDWTLDMTISLGDNPTYRVFGIRSGTYLKNCSIFERKEKDPLYVVSVSIHIGNGIVVKDSFKLKNISGLDFWFMRKY